MVSAPSGRCPLVANKVLDNRDILLHNEKHNHYWWLCAHEEPPQRRQTSGGMANLTRRLT